ncbi:MAG: hypothetical protein QOG63_1933 [Thermoleophilaceae bacterium]|jgi:hypothetical protein|nr:hypothetical protein [Thermoleophilaceae bacterium]
MLELPPDPRPRRARRRRWAIGAAAAVVVLVVASQLALVPYAEQRVVDALTANGGRATVEIEAFPALRLIAHDGDRIRIRGSGLRLEPGREAGRALAQLDHFGAVDIELRSVTTGPLRADAFSLRRSGPSGHYRLNLRGSLSAAGAATYLTRQWGPLAAGLSGFAFPAKETTLQINLAATLAHDDRGVRVLSVTGPLADGVNRLLAGALANSLPDGF